MSDNGILDSDGNEDPIDGITYKEALDRAINNQLNLSQEEKDELYSYLTQEERDAAEAWLNDRLEEYNERP